jgi:transposase InsO family protein
MALNQEKKSIKCHSDTGLQYCANDFQSILNKNGILISMTQNSEPFENAVRKE